MKSINIAVIFAGGVGNRMRSRGLPKQFLSIHGEPIIIHTLKIWEGHDEIDAIVIACHKDWIDYLKTLIEKYRFTKVKCIVPGGDTGQQSIYNGLKAASKLSKSKEDIVLIHDGVRPLINHQVITDNIACVKKYRTAITCVDVIETVVLCSEQGEVIEVPERKNSKLARAPQSFYLNDIIELHEKAIKEGITNFIDSCTMMNHYHVPLHYVNGPKENIKITTPEDFYTMRALLDAKENEQIYGYESE